MFFTGAKMACTSARSCWSIGSAAHFAHVRMLLGLALPATVVAISGWSSENCRASLAMSDPRAAQWAAALRAAALTASGSLSQAGSGAFVSSRALNGPAFYGLPPNEARVTLTRHAQAQAPRPAQCATAAGAVLVFDPPGGLHWTVADAP